MRDRPLVSICCLTYNHEPYIRECLEGFLMQKCEFTFEVLIHDDASTDGTAKIIKEYETKYPEIIKPIYQNENQYSKREGSLSLRYNFPRAKGVYIAMCEGDDYWTDPFKLQKQVSFLEANNQYSVCWHRYQVSQNGKITGRILPEISDDFVITKSNFFDKWYTKTLSVVFRKKALSKIDFSKYNNFKDSTLFYEFLKQGYGLCFKFVGGIYQNNSTGIWSSLSEKLQLRSASLNIEELYRHNTDDIFLQNNLKGLIKTFVQKGHYSDWIFVLSNFKTAKFKLFLINTIFRMTVNKFFSKLRIYN